MFEPISGTSATVDWYRVKRTNEIVQADPAAISAGHTPNDPTLANAVVPGNQPNSFIFYDQDAHPILQDKLRELTT